MTEIPLHLPTPSVPVPGWVRGVFAGRIPRRTTEAIQPLGEIKPAIEGYTPVFSLRFGESPVEERRLTKDALAYNAAKYALKPTDPDGYAQVMATYEALRKRYATPLPRGVSITVFGRSLFVSTSRESISERVDKQYLSPFQPSPRVTLAPSPALGD